MWFCLSRVSERENNRDCLRERQLRWQYIVVEMDAESGGWRPNRSKML